MSGPPESPPQMPRAPDPLVQITPEVTTDPYTAAQSSFEITGTNTSRRLADDVIGAARILQ